MSNFKLIPLLPTLFVDSNGHICNVLMEVLDGALGKVLAFIQAYFSGFLVDVKTYGNRLLGTIFEISVNKIRLDNELFSLSLYKVWRVVA